MEDDDDQSTCIEPVISYYSPLTNRGVKEISNTKCNSARTNYNQFSSYPLPTSSVNNTIMLPFISSDGSIGTDISYKNMNNSIPISKGSKENSSNNYYMKFDNTRIKTISSKSVEDQNNNESINLKITNTYNDNSNNLIKKTTTYIPKRFSQNLPETNYQDMLDFKNNYNEQEQDQEQQQENEHEHEHNYESDHTRRYNKKYTQEIKGSIRTTKTRHIQMNDEKMPSLFLKAEKTDKKNNNKNIFIFKNKKRRKTQKVISKTNKMALKKKDKPVNFFIEKSKSFGSESMYRNCQSSYKKDKMNDNNPERNLSKNASKSNKNLKNLKQSLNNEDAIKKNWTSKIGLMDKFKSNIKPEKKKTKKKNDRKISFKENNLNNKLVKVMFSRNTAEIKTNKYESTALKMLRDHINNRNYKEKKEEEKNKKEKIKKSVKKSTNSKDKEKGRNSDQDSKNEDRRQSGFLSKDEVMKKMFDRQSFKDRKISKKDKAKHNETYINNDSKKEMNKLKLNEGNKTDSNNNLLLTVSRRKRSISLHYQNDKMNEISEALRAKIPRKILNLNNPSSSTLIPKRKKKKKLSDVEVLLKKKMKDEQYNLFTKYTNTVYTGPDFTQYIISCLELITELDKDSQVRLKSKINFNFPKSKKKGTKKRIALFDLDETLVHCTGDIKTSNKKYQHTIDITLPGKNSVKVGINLRPLWKETLELIKKKYHIVIHTASHQAYADAVLDFMDPEKKYFKYRLYRNNCSLVDIDGVKFYVKDLDIFDEYYDLKDVVIIDNSVLSFAYHLYNGIPIVPYYEGDKDNFLYVVGLYLVHIYKAKDLRDANKKLINLDYFFDIAKTQVENADNIIDEESNVIEEDEENSQNDIKGGGDTLIIMKTGDETGKSRKARHKSGKSAYESRRFLLGSNSPIGTRRTAKDLSENKLMSNSDLFNMYLELTENKNLINNKFSLTSKETKKERSLNIINFSNYAKLVNEDIKEVNKENEKDIDVDVDCKSQPEAKHFSFGKSNNLTDDENSVKKAKNLKRVISLVDGDFIAKKIRDAIMGNLNTIKTNFSNKFKDLDNISDND